MSVKVHKDVHKDQGYYVCIVYPRLLSIYWISSSVSKNC